MPDFLSQFVVALSVSLVVLFLEYWIIPLIKSEKNGSQPAVSGEQREVAQVRVLTEQPQQTLDKPVIKPGKPDKTVQNEYRLVQPAAIPKLPSNGPILSEPQQAPDEAQTRKGIEPWNWKNFISVSCKLIIALFFCELFALAVASFILDVLKFLPARSPNWYLVYHTICFLGVLVGVQFRKRTWFQIGIVALPLFATTVLIFDLGEKSIVLTTIVMLFSLFLMGWLALKDVQFASSPHEPRNWKSFISAFSKLILTVYFGPFLALPFSIIPLTIFKPFPLYSASWYFTVDLFSFLGVLFAVRLRKRSWLQLGMIGCLSYVIGVIAIVVLAWIMGQSIQTLFDLDKLTP